MPLKSAEALRLVEEGVARILTRLARREMKIAEPDNPRVSRVYAIVAMGNINGDIVQAQAATR